MAPPKKDAFADLFHSAAGTSNLSLDLPMKNLSMRDQLSTSNGLNMSRTDILSPTSYRSPQGSKPATPKPTGMHDLDPFSIFEKPSPSKPALNTVSQTQKPQQTTVKVAPHARHQQPEISLLDDEFTDVFETQSVASAPVSTNTREDTSLPHPTLPPRPKENTAEDSRDEVLAGLVDIGFSLSVSNQAIDAVGADLQACVNHIMSNGNRQDPTSGRGDSRTPPDLSATLQDFSTDLFKRATKLLDKSKRTVIKNINQFHANQGKSGSDGLPAWMIEQDKYKENASERKKGGGVYEDYGDDRENINKDDIQRIMRAQRQREKERQRERLERNGRGSTSPSPSPATNNVSRSDASSKGSSPFEKPVPSITREASDSLHANDSQKSVSKEQPHVKPPPEPSVDLLGLNGSTTTFSRTDDLKQSGGESIYQSPSRRRSPNFNASTKARLATNEVLNAFQKSDYETFKASASTAFNNGNYTEAFERYMRCLEALPVKHELRIVILSNLAITLIKVGNYKSAKQNCDDGIALVGENVNDEDWVINSKPVKYWYLRLLSRKAESLEMLENYPEALECYLELITKHNVNDKKVMDAKRRINNIINPPKKVAKLKPTVTTPSVKKSEPEALKRIRDQHSQEKLEEEEKFRLSDQVHEKIFEWSRGKEDNLRSLLMSLADILPARLGFPFITEKKLTINDLMLTKKVKIHYMKVISSIHPDKLGKFDLEDQMICQGVFIVLNKAWDTFKEQNNIV